MTNHPNLIGFANASLVFRLIQPIPTIATAINTVPTPIRTFQVTYRYQA